ncbi:uncharacterized protein LOC128241813 [Mya arenaria]|uniref:uncharacterized protein LOC128241813 n=1 Tax=Mya arenaria TaxID=6604 RepID=UPI0022E84E82|nr:uncharacterized protein LOC128241813 [Mya arenaria]
MGIKSKKSYDRRISSRIKRYNVCGSSYHLHSPVVWDTVCVSVRWESMTGVSVMEIVPLDFCSFFNNRAPSPQVNLRNCTWFKKSSCCTQEEIDATFGTVKPLPGSTPGCQRYTNYLMCRSRTSFTDRRS